MDLKGDGRGRGGGGGLQIWRKRSENRNDTAWANDDGHRVMAESEARVGIATGGERGTGNEERVG